MVIGRILGGSLTTSLSVMLMYIRAAMMSCRVSMLVTILIATMPWPTSQALQTPSAGNATDLYMPDEVRLVNDLLDVYKMMGTVARPALNSSRLMKVEFGMRLIQMDIIEKEQVLQTSVWIRARWIDEFLRWNPGHYGDIKEIVLPWQQVWTPDIVLVNTAETDVAERHADIMVTYQGAVVWSPHRLFKSACLIDVTDFPYDRHTCDMWFQSMARFSWQMDIWPYGRSPWDLETYLASFKKSQEWEIVFNGTERVPKSRDMGVMLKFSRRVALRFTLTVQRRLGYTCHLLMLPCVFLGCMTLVVFCLPPERPDRHTLATSLLGSFMVLTLILVEVAPPTASSVPKLGMYYACNMTLVMISVFLSGIVINVSRRGDRKQLVPRLVKTVIIDGLSRVLLLHSRVSRSFQWTVTSVPEDSELWNIELAVNEPDTTSHIALSEFATDIEKALPGDSGSNNRLLEENAQDNNNMLARKMNSRLKRVEEIVKNCKPQICDEKKNIELLKLQWAGIALVLDRFFFFMYLITLATTLIILFPRQSL